VTGGTYAGRTAFATGSAQSTEPPLQHYGHFGLWIFEDSAAGGLGVAKAYHIKSTTVAPVSRQVRLIASTRTGCRSGVCRRRRSYVRAAAAMARVQSM
jgi:hypothetical protein